MELKGTNELTPNVLKVNDAISILRGSDQSINTGQGAREELLAPLRDFMEYDPNEYSAAKNCSTARNNSCRPYS